MKKAISQEIKSTNFLFDFLILKVVICYELRFFEEALSLLIKAYFFGEFSSDHKILLAKLFSIHGNEMAGIKTCVNILQNDPNHL